MEGPNRKGSLPAQHYTGTSPESRRKEQAKEPVSKTSGESIISQSANQSTTAVPDETTHSRVIATTDRHAHDTGTIKKQVDENIKALWLVKVAQVLPLLANPSSKPECISHLTITIDDKVVYKYPDPERTAGLDDNLIQQLLEALPNTDEETTLLETKNSLSLYKQALLDEKQQEQDAVESTNNDLIQIIQGTYYWHNTNHHAEYTVSGQLTDTDRLIRELEENQKFKEMQKEYASETSVDNESLPEDFTEEAPDPNATMTKTNDLTQRQLPPPPPPPWINKS